MVGCKEVCQCQCLANTFAYFAYGSNLWKQRMNLPIARFVGIGKLKNHRLDFLKYSELWQGSTATIVPTKGSEVWGAIWLLDYDDMPALDKQEAVDSHIYFPKYVDVIIPDGTSVQCRTYQQVVIPLSLMECEQLPEERQPSKTYLNCIIDGAKECKLPKPYIEELMRIPHNGKFASDNMLKILGLNRTVLEMKEGFKTPRGMVKSEIPKADTFIYFAYGPNMLTFRMHMNVPSAQLVSIARADNYRLDFIKYSSFWGGPTATMVPTANAHVWGVVWRVETEESEQLDEVKDLEHRKYYKKYMDVLSPHMGYLKVRVYIQEVNPLPLGDGDELPVERWPSWTLQQIMILGAIENGIPHYYIWNLKKLPNNGEEGALRTVCMLNRYARDPPCECNVPGRIPRRPLKLDLRKLRAEQERKDEEEKELKLKAKQKVVRKVKQEKENNDKEKTDSDTPDKTAGSNRGNLV